MSPRQTPRGAQLSFDALLASAENANHSRAIFSAASHAQRAADFLHGLQQPKPMEAVSAAA
jgi:antirestriction protein ArdC